MRVDSVFAKAANVTGLDLEMCVEQSNFDEVIMWVDPGSVIVKKTQSFGYHMDVTEIVLFENGEVKQPQVSVPSPSKSPSFNFSPSKSNTNYGYMNYPKSQSPILFSLDDIKNTQPFQESIEMNLPRTGQSANYNTTRNAMYARNVIH
eukprot:TRINITY_DN1371_c0_g1_i2.p1 TRINITY_DN1371_c0_g1~~TRINITY_DN1371_c0_g1_i2.p1  ORF type:complete len:148 (-),score=26.40 TRINITY_DN1371_c0_g1_i2:90-533(-)